MCTYVIPIAELRTACPCSPSQSPKNGPFHHTDVDSSQSHQPIVRVRTGSNRNKVSIFFCRCFVCDFQQRFNPQGEVSKTWKNLLSHKRTCIDFSKAFEKDSKSSQKLLTSAKVERCSNLSKDNFFSHCYEDIRELSNGQTCLCSRFEQISEYVFCIKNVDLRSFQQPNEWPLDFGQDSVSLTVIDLVLEGRKSSQDVSLPAWNLLFQTEEVLNNLLDWIPFLSQAARILWKKEVILANAGLQNMDSIG